MSRATFIAALRTKVNMDLSEINNLIQVRNYVANATNNYSLSKVVVAELSTMLLLLDRLIVEKLTGKDFKEYINFADKAKAIADVAKITNIKSGLKV